ncbi:hypothetical protein [Paracoccus beibuensis]|uniref:hypothetical protein n=1 Tax=Paracoccus beibuensis TaxID=547602 RepID=UPI002240B932|nr:hypothetical protein [Paracoccus beibuensis]
MVNYLKFNNFQLIWRNLTEGAEVRRVMPPQAQARIAPEKASFVLWLLLSYGYTNRGGHAEVASAKRFKLELMLAWSSAAKASEWGIFCTGDS